MSPVFLLALAAAALFIGGAGEAKAAPLEIHTASGQVKSYDVALATNPAMRARGLMGVTSLRGDEGMLFVFDKVEPVRFWMKDTPLPLDMIFIDDKGRIRMIHPQARPFDLSPVSSKDAVRAVLELSGGTAQRDGLRVGDRVVSPRR